MAKIYEYFGIMFSFFSREHLPIHVHAQYGRFITIFEIITDKGRVIDIQKRRKKGAHQLPPSQMRDAEKFVWARKEQIIKKWHEVKVMNKTVSPERVTYKVNYK